MILTLLLTTIFIVFVIDLSGFTDTWKGWLSRWLGVQVGRVKPFDCSLCMSFWVNTIIALCASRDLLASLAMGAIFAFLADVIAEALHLIKDILRAVLNALYKLINRL